MKKQVKMISIIVLALIIVIFALLNVQSVAINFGFGTLKLPMIVMLILWILIGALVSFLLTTTSSVTKSRDIKKLNQENDAKVNQLNKQLTELKAKLKNENKQENLNRNKPE